MAKKNKSKPSRNVLVEPVSKSKGRGKNKTTETKAKRGKLSTRLFCVPLTTKKRGKEAKFECFGSFEDAQVALLARSSSGAVNPALAEMLKMQATAGLRGRRGLRALPARGLRGTWEEHADRMQELYEEFDPSSQSEEEQEDTRSRLLEEARWLDGPGDRGASQMAVHKALQDLQKRSRRR